MPSNIDISGQHDLYKRYIFYAKIYYALIDFKFEDIYNYELIKEHEDKLSISAEVVLKPNTGKSMMKSNTSITTENVKDFEPSEENKKFAGTTLEELGFDVGPSSGITLTITGDKSLFEKIFKTELNVEKSRITINPSKQLVIPDRLSDVVENIVFTPPPQFFKSP